MKHSVRYGVIALMLYVVFLLVLLPADRVYAVLKEKIALPVSLYQISGSVWNGNAEVAMLGNQRLEAFEWRLKPLALFLGRLQLVLGFNKNDGSVSTVAGRSFTGDYYLHDMNASLPATEFESLFGNIKLGLSGNITVKLREARITGNRLTAIVGNIAWQNAGLTSSTAGSVGSFEINFETTAEGIKGVLKDIDGPLQANGILKFKPDGSYLFNAAFTPRDATRNDIKQALRFLGNPDPSGKVTVSEAGNLQLNKYLPFLTPS